MMVTSLFKPGEALEAIGIHCCAWFDVLFEEGDQSCALEIGNDRHTSAPSSTPTFLHGHQDQRCFSAFQLPASLQTGLHPSHPSLIDFYFAPKRLACEVDHRSTEFV